MAKAKTPARRTRRRPAPRRTSGARAAELVVAGLAHDIRTPLTGILALSELLSASDLGERERRWVAALRSNAEHLAALTTLVVDAARTGERKLALRRDAFDPRRLAQAAATSLAARAEAAGLACKVEITDALPQAVIGDAVRLRAALENLIDNAVKFTERGGVGLTVTMEKARVRGGRRKRAGGRPLRLIFAVSDSGIGLTAREMRQLFRPFTQANEAIAHRFGGAGLGLALVKRLAKAMGGDLTVASKPARGSTFRLSVTVAEDAPRSFVGSDTRPRPLSVLYVEDNPYGRVVISTMLAGLGHQVEFARTGEAAIEAVRAGSYDLVLMDVVLAGIDGIEAARRIRALGNAAGQVPIIGLSGDDTRAREQAARAAGMNAYLAKPVGSHALANAIATLFAR